MIFKLLFNYYFLNEWIHLLVQIMPENCENFPSQLQRVLRNFTKLLLSNQLFSIKNSRIKNSV